MSFYFQDKWVILKECCLVLQDKKAFLFHYYHYDIIENMSLKLFSKINGQTRPFVQNYLVEISFCYGG